MRRRNPAPDAPWVEQVQWNPGSDRFNHVVVLQWIEADRLAEDGTAPIWRIFHSLIDPDARRYFGYGLAAWFVPENEWLVVEREWKVDIGFASRPRDLTNDDLRTIGIRGQFILQRMLTRVKELRRRAR